MVLDGAQADDIANDLTYRSAQAMLAGDFDKLADCFMFPLLKETDNGTILIRSKEEFRPFFNDWYKALAERGVHDLVRTVVSSEYINADTIGSTFVSLHIDENNQPIGKPFPVYSLIRRKGAAWRVTYSRYVQMGDADLLRALSPETHSKLVSGPDKPKLKG